MNINSHALPNLTLINPICCVKNLPALPQAGVARFVLLSACCSCLCETPPSQEWMPQVEVRTSLKCPALTNSLMRASKLACARHEDAGDDFPFSATEYALLAHALFGLAPFF